MEYIPQTWVNRATKLGPTTLQPISDALADATTHHKSGTLANRPPANATSKGWIYFATDTGVTYANFDGANWTSIAGVVTAGDPSFQVAQVTAAGSYTFTNLDGDADEAYEITMYGSTPNTGAGRNITVRPNNITATQDSEFFASFSNPGTSAPGSGNFDQAANSGLHIIETYSAQATDFAARGVLQAKTGQERVWSCWSTIHARGARATENSISGGHWRDTTTKITSITIDCGGGTFTGTITLRKIAKIGQAIAGIGGQPIESWHSVGAAGEPAFAGAWVNFDPTEQSAQFRKEGDIVRLRGVVKSGAVPSTIFTLPAGYRPPKNVRFAAAANGAFGYISVAPDGTVVFQAGSNVYVDLSTVIFSITLGGGAVGAAGTTSGAGTLAQRPAANAVQPGFLYLATDDRGGTVWRSDGTNWVQAAASALGPNTVTAVTGALLNSWSVYNDFKWWVDQGNVAHLVGELLVGSVSAGLAIWTLPTAIRPTFRRYFSGQMGGTGSTGAFSSLMVNTTQLCVSDEGNFQAGSVIHIHHATWPLF